MGAAVLCGLAVGAVLTWLLISALRPSSKVLEARYLELMEAKEFAEAEAAAAQWAAISPETGEPWIQWAEALKRGHKFELAFNCLSHVPEDSPQWENAKLTQIDLQFGPLNRPEAGAYLCEQVLSSNPMSALAQQRLIFFLTFTLQRPRLSTQIRSAIDLGVEPIESYVYLFYLDSLAFSNGLELNNRWLKGSPNSELFEVAAAIFISEILDLSIPLDDVQAALTSRQAASRKGAVLERLLAKYPNNLELLAYQIRQATQVGDLEKAVELLAQVTVDGESDSRFWRYKGWVESQRNQDVEAEESYRRSIQLNPLEWTTRHLLAELLQKQKRFDEVKTLRELAKSGNELRTVLQHSPNAKQIPLEILDDLANYAAACGDRQVSEGLRKRIEESRNRQRLGA